MKFRRFAESIHRRWSSSPPGTSGDVCRSACRTEACPVYRPIGAATGIGVPLWIVITVSDGVIVERDHICADA